MLYSDLDVLTALVSGDADGYDDFSYERHETAGLSSDVYRLMIDGVTHLGVSDFALFVRAPWRTPLYGGIDARTVIGIQNDFVRGFFDKHLRGLRVLERIQRLPSDAPTSIEMVRGQILEEPVVIRRAYRVAGAADL